MNCRSVRIVLTLTFCLSATIFSRSVNTVRRCNGSAHLCTKRYNEVCYPTSHNGASFLKPTFSAFTKLNLRDQDQPLTQQMEGGIRATKIAIRGYGSNAYTCHGSCYLNYLPLPLKKILAEVKEFLDTYPHEIFTLLLEDELYNNTLIQEAFSQSGIMPYMHHQKSDQPWPTLGSLIEQNKRLIVFMGGGSNWKAPFHPTWQYMWDTPFHYSQKNALINDTTQLRTDWTKKATRKERFFPYRGVKAFQNKDLAPKNKLWILWHFITPLIHGSITSAKIVNQFECIKKRMSYFSTLARSMPNFIVVDFWQYGAKGVLEATQWANYGHSTDSR